MGLEDAPAAANGDFIGTGGDVAGAEMDEALEDW